MSDINSQKLFNPQILAEIEKRFNSHILLSNDPREALQFVRWLEPIMETANVASMDSVVVEQYWAIVIKCKFMALALLTPREIEELFERQFTGLFLMPEYYDVWERLRVKFVAIPEYAERDEWKKRLREALLRNQEFLGGDIFIEEDGQNKPGTIENWLRNYIAAVGSGFAETIKRREYLTQSKNVQKLRPEEREKIEQLIVLFENLKISSLTMNGLEERVMTELDGKLMVFRGGRLEEINQNVWDIIKNLGGVDNGRPLEEAAKNKILEAYWKSKDTILAIEKEKDDLVKIIGSEQSRAYDILSSFIIPASPTALPPARARFLALLLIFAEKGWLLKILEEQNPVREQFVKYLRQEGSPEAAQNFTMTPTAPLSLGKFLKFVLLRRMRMSETEAAAIAVRMGNLMKAAGKPEYWDMAYYDQASGGFKWKG